MLRILLVSVLTAAQVTTALATAANANEPFPSSMHKLVLQAPKTALILYIASYPEQIVGALRCRHYLDVHTGVLYSYSDRTSLVLAPRNAFLTTDEIILDASGSVTAIILNEPPYVGTQVGSSRMGVWIRARYIIDLASGEIDADGISLGTRFKIPERADLMPVRQHPVLALPCQGIAK